MPDDNAILNEQIRNAAKKAENDERRDFQRQARRAGDPVGIREARAQIAAKREGDRDAENRIRSIAREEALSAMERITISGDGVEGASPEFIIGGKKQAAGGNARAAQAIALTYIDNTGAKAVANFVIQ